jgi:putative protease
VDRQEGHLRDMILQLEKELVIGEPLKSPPGKSLKHPQKTSHTVNKKTPAIDLRIDRMPVSSETDGDTGIWLSPESVTACRKHFAKRAWWWLPPVVWPVQTGDLHETIARALRLGARRFVLNMPWQSVFFKGDNQTTLWAGPFCNITNGLAVQTLKGLGFSGVIVSPELGKEDYLALPGQSILPLGMILSANWPLCISRTLSEQFRERTPFTSPKGETAWAVNYGDNFWLFPNWKVDLREKRDLLAEAGYTVFVHLSEPVPETVSIKQRPGLWNWNVGMQ